MIEGPGFNVFAVINGGLVTPETGVLQGITRKTIFEIADSFGVKAEQGLLSADQLRMADEVFITSTAGGVMPVTVVDTNKIGNGLVGTMTKQIKQAYWALHDDDQYCTAIS